MTATLPVPAKALLGGLIAVVILALFEAILAVADVPAAGIYRGDPAVLWSLRADLDEQVRGGATPAFHLQTNALGLRGEMPPDNGPWTLALGCSTTLGWGVEADQAWPAQFERRIHAPVVNGGMPGWSTEQAVVGARRWLELGPTRVIVAYMVRDAWPAKQPDSAARATPWWRKTRLMRALRGGLDGQTRTPAGRLPPTPAVTARVPPERYADNLRAITAMVGQAEVIWLAFPQPDVTPLEPWRAAMASVASGASATQPLSPSLPRSAFFEDDPVHLTAEGHRALADAMVDTLVDTLWAHGPR